MSVSGRGEVPIEAQPGPAGSVRLLLPLEAEARDVRIELIGDESPSAVGVLEFRLEPPREWTIHLVHHSHLDIGYTDPQGTVLGEHVAFLDSALDLGRVTDDWPDDARFRWAVESLWSFEQWAAARPPERVAEFVERVRAGRIELTAMPYNLHTDTCSTDELHELLKLARDVRQRYDVEIVSAMQTDVPGTVAGLPDALAQQGVRYLSVAHNWAGRSVPHLVGGNRLPRLFRWRAPSGAEVLVWMTDSPHGLAYMEGPVLGFDTSYELVDDLLPAYLTSLATRPYPFPAGMFGWHGPEVTDRDPYPWDVLHLRVHGHFGDNAPPRLILAETVRRWNETWEFPRVRLSTNTDFFRDAESRLGAQIPCFEGDWGDWWVEGVGSGARPQAMVRRAQAAVTDGQSLYAMAALQGHDEPERLAAETESLAAKVYQATSLFDEHTWGASNPWSYGDEGVDSGEQQWHWKYAHAINAQDDARVFVDHASAALGALLPAPAERADSAEGGRMSFWAVDPAPYTRTCVVRLFVRESRIPFGRGLIARDGRTGDVLPAVEEPQTNPTHRDAGRFLRVRVPDVPAFGAVRIDVAGEAEVPTPEGVSGPSEWPTERDLALENDHLRVRIDLRHACIASIVERATGRELVDREAIVGFAGYVYDTYTTAGGYNHQANKTSVSDELELLGSRTLARPAVLVERVDDPIEQRITYAWSADGLRSAETTVRLGRHAAHVEIDHRFDKPATMTKESAYLAFPFAMTDPTVHYEITGALTGTDLEHVPGAPRHMRAIRSYVSFEDAMGPACWVTRDAPLVEPETIALPYAPFPDSTAPRQPGTVYSWVHNNLWDTNFPSQQAFSTVFRYAVGVRRAGESLSGDALGARTAYEIDHPPIGVAAEGERVADCPAQLGLLALDDPRVVLRGVLPLSARDSGGRGGVLVRLQSFATEPVTVRLTCGFEVSTARLATYLGDRLGPADPDDPDGPGSPADELVPRDGVVEVSMPRLGVAAVRLERHTA